MGHDFRPAYLNLGAARKAIGNPPVLALTATATQPVIEEILASLCAPKATQINVGSERENLFLSVLPTVNNEAKLNRILDLLEREQGTGIIYTASVRAANELFDFLNDHGISSGRYHGKMKTHEREAAQQAFMRGDHEVMIATKAFGLGIDKPDIRFVFHFEFPDSLETYYQEAGRAGRDGLPAQAVLLYRLEDKRIQSFFLAGRYPRLTELRAILDALSPILEAESVSVPDEEPYPTHSEPNRGEVSPAELNRSSFRPLNPDGPTLVVVSPQTAFRNESAGLPEQASKVTTSSQPHHGQVDYSLTTRPPRTAAEIASAASIPLRRTQVILHLLTEAALLKHTKTTYSLSHPDSEPATDQDLEALLASYTARAACDQDRLAEMMHYAETPNCRNQAIRAYFGEPEGEPCNRCDNCRNQFAIEVPTQNGSLSIHSVYDPSGPARRKDPGIQLPVNGQSTEPTLPNAHGQPVYRIETAFGDAIYTTRPIIANGHATPQPARLQPGSSVTHKRFGPGKVLDLHNDQVLVHFNKAGQKRLRSDFLQPA